MSRIAQDAINSPQQDQAFLRAATEGGLDEVTLGSLAAHKSDNPEIQAFGRLVRDHTRINNEIAPIAERLGVTPPAKLADEDQVEYDKLRLMPSPTSTKPTCASWSTPTAQTSQPSSMSPT